MNGGAKESRTPDLYTASVALYQLSYGPTCIQIECYRRDRHTWAEKCNGARRIVQPQIADRISLPQVGR